MLEQIGTSDAQIHSETGISQDLKNIWTGFQAEFYFFAETLSAAQFFPTAESFSPLKTIEEYIESSPNCDLLRKNPLTPQKTDYINAHIKRINFLISELEILIKSPEDSELAYQSIRKGIVAELAFLNEFIAPGSSITTKVVHGYQSQVGNTIH